MLPPKHFILITRKKKIIIFLVEANWLQSLRAGLQIKALGSFSASLL